MGTSNFLYRDTLYALDTYVPADATECTCDQEALAVTCDHESDCPAIDGYHDESIYDDVKAELMHAFKGAKAKHATAIYEVAGERTNDTRNFEGHIIGRAYFEVNKLAYTLGIENIELDLNLAIGDDYCLRSGYYSGFNFDRVTCRYADYATDELDALLDAIHERLHKYDEAYINEWLADREAEVQDGSFDTLADACEAYGLEIPTHLDLLSDTDELFDYIVDLIHANIMDNVTAAVNEMNALYDELGNKHFDRYRFVARASNGETSYEKVNA